MNIRNKFYNGLSKINYKVAYKIVGKRRFVNANNRLFDKPKQTLSLEERRLFKKTWNGYKPDSHEFYKAYGCGFDVTYVPNDYYDFAEHVLNLRWASFFLQHKCNLKFIIPKENRPKSILQKINGHYVLEDNSELSKTEAQKILQNSPVYMCKIAMSSGGGKGVHKVCQGDKYDYEKLLKPEDLIFQEVLTQSDFMKSLNPDSVNTFRLLTLNINGRCTVLSSFVRMGAKGAFVDNLSRGGGCLVGINQNGEFNEFGIKKDYSKVYYTSSGLLLKGMRVPNWEYIKMKIVCFHQHIPYAGIIGWDIAIDQNGEPIVIEINLDSAEIEAHQIFNGPVFGDRFDEVRNYIENKKSLLRRAMILY